MNKISVIIPVYNVEQYIEECLDSLLNQTYKNLEIICIDDGSTDRSGWICDQYVKKDSRIKVIHQKNSGAGAARNKGLDIASGDYIAFVDSDDYIEKNMYEELYNALIFNNAQIAGCETISLFQDKINYPNTTGKEMIFSGVDFLALSSKHWKYYIMVNKLFSRAVVGNMRFPEKNVIDDGFFTYQIIARAARVVWCDKAFYFYRQRKSSVMNKKEYQLKRDYDAVKLFKERLEFVKARYPKVISSFQVKMIDSYINIILREELDDQDVKKCLSYMRRNCQEALFKEYSYKESVWIILFMFFPNVMIKRSRNRYQLNAEEKIKGVLFE